MRSLYLPAVALLGLLAGCDADKMKDFASNNSCSLDSPVAGTTVMSNVPFEPWGWAYNVVADTLPKDVTLQIINAKNDVVLTSPVTRAPRPDVAKALGKPDLTNSGFVAKLDISKLEAGTYSIKVIQQEGNSRYNCSSPTKFKIQANKG